MKILLTTLNSKYVHSNLALKYLYAVAQDWSPQVELKEFTINHPLDYVFGEILRGEYDAVCFSCYIWNIRQICELAEQIKLVRPQAFIVLGGPEVSFGTQRFLEKHWWADFVLMGEGEGVFYRFLEQLHSPKPDFGSVAGLAWRSAEITVNALAPPLKIESIPFPYEYLPAEEDKVLYYESSRGCPFRCAYCLSSVDRAVRALSPVRVESELSYFIYKKVKQVKFIDRTFNYDSDRCQHILKYLMDHDNGVTNFHFELCGDLIDEATIELVKCARPGLFQFEIGVQSTNEEVLRRCGRHCDFERLSQAVRKLAGPGNVHLHLDLIAGLPGEDDISIKKSFNDVYRLKPDALQLGFLKVLKGSPMADVAEEYGIIYRPQPPYEILESDALSADSLVRLKMVETVLDLYWNRGGFRRALNVMTDRRYLEPFDFYQQFAGFYYLKGYQHRSHKKEDLYRIFDQFARWREQNGGEPGEACELRDLLRQDMRDALNPEAIKKFERKGWELSC